MNIQQMMAQAQKMKRELDKALKALDEKEFTITKGGAVTVKMYGSNQIISISVDEDAFEKDNKEMVEDMIAMAINEGLETIAKERDEINERITGQASGFGF
ncbi:MAG: YbaB/EbfC family nucleoid-associated protein [Bacilli bacterium]|nr:YbaB/EbfC family nucleoid-associated protein [Bacilli bacterium]